MFSLIGFAKSMAITFVVIILMQIKVGESTVERELMTWLYTSTITEPLNEVAQGGAVFVRQTWRGITGSLNTKFTENFDSKNSPGRRSLGLNLERSKAYVKSQAKELQQKTEDSAQRADFDWRKLFTREEKQKEE